MMRKCIVGLFLLISSGYAYAQTSTCAQTLRLARSTYEQGRFHEIPALLEVCLVSGFTKQEKVEALRILTLAYLYQEEPEEADKSMQRLLETDHFFEINENVDPAEFTALYKTFRTKPLFAIGVRFGPNYTLPKPTTNYFVGSSANNAGEYSPLANIQLGLSFEKHLFEKNPKSRWTAAPEIMFINHSFSYANEEIITSDETGESYAFMEGTFDQTRFDLNLLVQYKLKESTVNPYVTFGGAVSYLTKAQLQVETQFPEEGSVVTGPAIDVTDTFNSLDYAIIAGGGIKYKFGEIYLLADIRYKYGLTNLINESARSNPEATFDYGFVSNDMTLGSIIASIGFVWPYFNPKKLVK